MNVDVQIYLSNFKSFFNNNPNDLINLIGDGDKDMFFELVEGMINQKYEKVFLNFQGNHITMKKVF